MKKLLISILVLSVPVLSVVERVEGMAQGLIADTQGRIWYPPNVNAASPILSGLTASAVTVFEIQDDTGSFYIVCLETAAQPADKPADRATSATIANSLPEPTTIVMLGLCGFMLRRRKTTSR